MTQYHESQQRDVILFVGGSRDDAVSVIKDYSQHYGKTVTGLYLGNITSKDYARKISQADKKLLIEVPVTFKKLTDGEISKILRPYKDRLLTATCTKEYNIGTYRKIVPHIPYLFAPTQESLLWSTDKVEMRQRIKESAPDICPRFMLVKDSSSVTLGKIEKQIGFPLVVKPAGLAASKHVTICYYREELEKSLRQVIMNLKRLYAERGREDAPKVLVEQFMEGSMYSIDAYVNSRGFVYHCPPVFVRTGMTIGFDDFFGYQRILPVKIKQYKIEQAERAVTEAIHALGLRNVTCHVELMRTEDGWKIIEVGPRVGGYRHVMYQLSYGINHLLNDTLIRVPQKPVIKRRVKKTVTVLQFFAKEEGILESISGLKLIRNLESFHSIDIRMKKGKLCRFAKNGGASVFDVVLAHKSRSQVLADVRRMEKAVVIKVKKVPRGAKRKA